MLMDHNEGCPYGLEVLVENSKPIESNHGVIRLQCFDYMNYWAGKFNQNSELQ